METNVYMTRHEFGWLQCSIVRRFISMSKVRRTLKDCEWLRVSKHLGDAETRKVRFNMLIIGKRVSTNKQSYYPCFMDFGRSEHLKDRSSD